MDGNNGIKSRAVFLDRDGTIIKDSNYVNHPSQVKLLKNAVPGILKFIEMGLLPIAVSNQSGVGRGYITKAMLDKITERLEEKLEKQGVGLADIYYAPFYAQAKREEFRLGEEDRKPNTGMISKAEEKFNIAADKSYMIGDFESDIMLGNRIKARTILVLTGKGRATHLWLKSQEKYEAHYIAKDLLDAANWIEKNEHKEFGFERKYKTPRELQALSHFRGKKKLVFTNGCFDILHLGHLKYLEQASREGDVFIVALNSDASVKILKGSSRPIFSIRERLAKIASLEFVDFVTVFDEETPYNLIKKLQPDVLVKGGDYTADKIVGADIVRESGGRVEVVPFIENHSTTGIIKKIKGVSL